MKKQEIEQLVEDLFPEFNITVEFQSNEDIDEWAAIFHIDGDNRRLVLNQKEFDKDSEEEDQMVILLHELGHVPNDSIKSPSEDEYLAQMWAIAKAEDLGLPEVRVRLIQDIISWGEFKWNEKKGQYRRYIIASKRFMKENIDDATDILEDAQVRAHASLVVRKNRARHF